MFICSFADLDDKYKWSKEFLENTEYGHKIRHELYENIIFPVLRNGYDNNDPWSLYWLAKTIRNVYGSERMMSLIDNKSDFALMKEYYKLTKSDEICLELLSRTMSSIGYTMHEWPIGIVMGHLESLDELLNKIEYARTLDLGNKYTESLRETEKIVYSEKKRLA